MASCAIRVLKARIGGVHNAAITLLLLLLLLLSLYRVNKAMLLKLPLVLLPGVAHPQRALLSRKIG